MNVMNTHILYLVCLGQKAEHWSLLLEQRQKKAHRISVGAFKALIKPLLIIV